MGIYRVLHSIIGDCRIMARSYGCLVVAKYLTRHSYHRCVSNAHRDFNYACYGESSDKRLCSLTDRILQATQDPGILPRNLDLDPPYPSSSPSNGSHVPLPRDLAVRMTTSVLLHSISEMNLMRSVTRVRVKYCTTCQTYRPPRSSHCKMVKDELCRWQFLSDCLCSATIALKIATIIANGSTIVSVDVITRLFLLS